METQDQIKKQIEEAKRREKVLRDKASPNLTRDVGTLDKNTPWVIVLLNLIPGWGASHWITPPGEKKAHLHNCVANLLPDDSFGENPKVCPACFAASIGGYTNIDAFQGKYQGATKLLYYYAYLGVIAVKTDGSKRIDWDDKPCVLRVRPSLNQIFSEKLGNVEYGDGDIRSYIWELGVGGEGFDKYKLTKPLVLKGQIVNTPPGLIEHRDEYIASLPKFEDLLAPGDPAKMIEDIGLEEEFIIQKAPKKSSMDAPPEPKAQKGTKGKAATEPPADFGSFTPGTTSILPKAEEGASDETSKPKDAVDLDDLPEIH